MSEFLRFRSEAGEFSAPASRRKVIESEGGQVVDKPAVDAKGKPLPFKPNVLRRSPGGHEVAQTTERPTSGQKANTAEKE